MRLDFGRLSLHLTVNYAHMKKFITNIISKRDVKDKSELDTDNQALYEKLYKEAQIEAQKIIENSIKLESSIIDCVLVYNLRKNNVRDVSEIVFKINGTEYRADMRVSFYEDLMKLSQGKLSYDDLRHTWLATVVNAVGKTVFEEIEKGYADSFNNYEKNNNESNE